MAKLTKKKVICLREWIGIGPGKHREWIGKVVKKDKWTKWTKQK